MIGIYDLLFAEVQKFEVKNPKFEFKTANLFFRGAKIIAKIKFWNK